MIKENKRIHLVNLYKWRSIVALFACLLTIILTIGSVVYGVATDPASIVRTEFEWFTVDSNCLTAFAAFLIIPFTIDGIIKKRFFCPKWAQSFHYATTTCTTLTTVFVLCFISWYDPELAFGEENFFLHIICPIAVLISFLMVESSFKLTRKDTLLAMIPFALYSLVYLYNVVITHNWQDHYKLNTFVPFYVSTPLMFILVYLIASAIRIVYNKLSDYRNKQLRIIWNEDLDPVTIKIEIYSLGVHAGIHQNKSNISIPFDILEEISKKFNVKMDELLRAYCKGVVDGIKEVEKEEKEK